MDAVCFDPTPNRTHKTCPDCKLFLTINKFWADKSSPDKHDTYCIKCKRARNNETRRKRCAGR